MPAKKKKKPDTRVRLSLWLEAGTYETLGEIAESWDTSRTAVIVRLIKNHSGTRLEVAQ